MTWRTLLNTLQWPIWEENLKRSGYICVHNWVTLLHTWNEHNFENQLYLTKKIFNVCQPFLRVDSSRTTEASSPQHTMCVVPVDMSSTACLEDLHKVETHLHTPTRPFCSGGCGGCREGHCLQEGAANMIHRRSLAAKSRSRKKRRHCWILECSSSL